MKKLSKTMLPLLIVLVVAIFAGLGTAYASIRFAKLPINCPTVEPVVFIEEIPQSSVRVMNTWDPMTIFQKKVSYDSVQDIIEDAPIVVEEMSVSDIKLAFPLIDDASFRDYVKNNPECMINGYEKLFIDSVDYNNTPTGIKTIHGDDVLALDVLDGIMIIGRDITTPVGTSKLKMAVVLNKAQMDMSLVENLGYWDDVEVHAERTDAILAINASSYNWNDAGAYATLYGATRFHGTTYRKAAEPENLICFAEDGTLSVGTSIDSAYNAVEMSPTLIKDGNTVYTADVGEDGTSTEKRYAQAAIGQTVDGVTMLVVASGGLYGSDIGATTSELMAVLSQYGAYNASALSGGSRTIMWWNGRTVNETVGYDQSGVRLPNTFYVKSIIHMEGTVLADSTPNADGSSFDLEQAGGKDTVGDVTDADKLKGH